MATKANVAILGASGYTGAELTRLLLRHPHVELAILTADRRAGQEMRAVFPQFSPFALPKLISIEAIEWASAKLDLVFCALPHGTTQEVIAKIFAAKPSMKVVDVSADFRLANLDAYAKWYGHAHQAPDLQKEAVYGLTEIYRDKIRGERAGPRRRTCCSPKSPKAFTLMASVIIAIWPSSIRNSRSPRARRSSSASRRT